MGDFSIFQTTIKFNGAELILEAHKKAPYWELFYLE